MLELYELNGEMPFSYDILPKTNWLVNNTKRYLPRSILCYLWKWTLTRFLPRNVHVHPRVRRFLDAHDQTGEDREATRKNWEDTLISPVSSCRKMLMRKYRYVEYKV